MDRIKKPDFLPILLLPLPSAGPAEEQFTEKSEYAVLGLAFD